jgi:hypothetical protein
MEQRMTQRISICPHCRDTYPDFDVAHVCSRGPYAPKLKLKKNERIRELSDRITEYLSNGGLFNPELANHLAVRDLLMECREVLNERTN